LTPPLEHGRAAVEVSFGPDGRQVISVSRGGARRTWNLPRETRSAAELQALSQLLAGDRINERGEYMPLPIEAQMELWSRLGGRQPEFTVSSETELRDWRRQRADDGESAGLWYGVRWNLDHLLAADPKDTRLRLRRGDASAEFGDWHEARKDFAAVAEQEPERYDAPTRLAVLELRAGNDVAYEETCFAMFTSCGAKPAPTTAHQIAWVCSLPSSRFIAQGAKATVVMLAERAATADPQQGRYLTTLGAAFYRAGRFEDAVAELDKACKLLPQGASPEPRYLLALAHQRLGHADDARRWLREADDHRSHALAHRSTVGWDRRLALELLRAEAEKAVGSAPS
jgi:tetratricopeptide (TPR) repeat protein